MVEQQVPHAPKQRTNTLSRRCNFQNCLLATKLPNTRRASGALTRCCLVPEQRSNVSSIISKNKELIMTHNDKMEHFFAHLIPPNFGTVFIWPTAGAGSTYFGYVLPKMKNNARNVMYLFVQSEGGEEICIRLPFQIGLNWRRSEQFLRFPLLSF